ncbi:hypothetical protein B0H10DRAFT_2083678 [Mycena sp. CBHHK59/15]|nr:hypothetical protein B0H10DRAFT_2083678 [Mycena sp. CBHHK59/15]
MRCAREGIESAENHRGSNSEAITSYFGTYQPYVVRAAYSHATRCMRRILTRPPSLRISHSRTHESPDAKPKHQTGEDNAPSGQGTAGEARWSRTRLPTSAHRRGRGSRRRGERGSVDLPVTFPLPAPPPAPHDFSHQHPYPIHRPRRTQWAGRSTGAGQIVWQQSDEEGGEGEQAEGRDGAQRRRRVDRCAKRCARRRMERWDTGPDKEGATARGQGTREDRRGSDAGGQNDGHEEEGRDGSRKQWQQEREEEVRLVTIRFFTWLR